MAVSRLETHETASQLIQSLMQDAAARAELTEAERNGLQVKVNTSYDMTLMAMRLRIMWKDPYGSDRIRCLDHIVNEKSARRNDYFATELKMVIDQIDLRGELFFFRLAKHFPSHLKRVVCDGKGAVRVEFKNGQQLTGTEAEVDDPEFIAKCGMMYDL